MLFNGRTLIFTFSGTQVRIAEIERLQSLFKTSMVCGQAYRMEPLVLKHYSTLKPLHLHKHDSAKKTPYEQMKATAFTQPSSPANAGDAKAKEGLSPQSKLGEIQVCSDGTPQGQLRSAFHVELGQMVSISKYRGTTRYR